MTVNLNLMEMMNFKVCLGVAKIVLIILEVIPMFLVKVRIKS